MSRAAAISRFMVAAGAFAVGGESRTEDEIQALRREMEAVRPLLDTAADRAVARAVKHLCDAGADGKTLERLMNALSARPAAIANAAPAASRPAPAAARLPYKDD